MFSISPSSALPLASMASTSEARRGSSAAAVRSSCAAPITAFSGVRSSWLMVARNDDLARLACSAASLAWAMAAAARFGSLMSTTVPTMPLTPPSAATSVHLCTSMSMVRPSCVWWRTS